MRIVIRFILIILFNIAIKASAQTDYKKMFRLYSDNDFINFLGNGTDRAYTGGMKLDWFYIKEGKQKFFLDRWMPKAGNNAVNTYNWSVMQIAYTPNQIADVEPAVNDYPYAGALFAIHGLHSSNPEKKYNLQTEIYAGVIGPNAFAGETQKGIHKIIKYQEPMGWRYQTPNDVAFNVNFGAEKMLYQPTNWIEIIGGAKAMMGTMQNGLYINTLIRFGKMNPYFDGFINQYTSPKKVGKKRFQVYAFAKPAVEWTFYNALLDGGIFNGKNSYYTTEREGQIPYIVSKDVHLKIDGGIVVSHGKTAFTFTQKVLAKQIEGFNAQITGNMSFYIGF